MSLFPVSCVFSFTPGNCPSVLPLLVCIPILSYKQNYTYLDFIFLIYFYSLRISYVHIIYFYYIHPILLLLTPPRFASHSLLTLHSLSTICAAHLLMVLGLASSSLRKLQLSKAQIKVPEALPPCWDADWLDLVQVCAGWHSCCEYSSSATSRRHC